jgi:probable HAF family extracellular repeat protein
MLDLGTLGGPDSWAASVNERGQVAGMSSSNSTASSSCNFPLITHPFLWDDGKMVDLGTLGGTCAVVGSLLGPGAGASLNNQGQVIGTSNLAGDLTHHPFLWDDGVLTDLGTLGGDNGEAWWINDRGEIVGRADLPGSKVHHAFLWKNGKMIDLGAAPGQPCSTAIDINSRGQIIIDTGICGLGGGPGLLWEDGNLYNLNDLVPSNSGLAVGDVNFINDHGEIAVTGIFANGDAHAVLLVPCDHDHAGLESCNDARGDATTASDIRPAQIIPLPTPTASEIKLSPAGILTRFPSVIASRNRRFGASPPR